LPTLVGREDEIAEVVALLSSEDASVVTLVGPGGTGKTRLALAVGEGVLATFADGSSSSTSPRSRTPPS